VTLEIDLKSKRALVTGAGQGVGKAIASTLARAGASVLVNDVVEPRAKQVVEEIRGFGGTAETAVFDVTDWSQVESGIDATVVSTYWSTTLATRASRASPHCARLWNRRPASGTDISGSTCMG
jgi:NAD(P)-dependent dehydrogenase (short-subunit alcohol dehydrogenase family)